MPAGTAGLASAADFGTALAAVLARRAGFVELETTEARGWAGLEAAAEPGAVDSLRETAGRVVVLVVGGALAEETLADKAFGAEETDKVDGFFEAEIIPEGLKPVAGATEGLPVIVLAGGGADDFAKGRVPGLPAVGVVLV